MGVTVLGGGCTAQDGGHESDTTGWEDGPMSDVVRAAKLSLALTALSRYNPEMPPRELYRTVFSAEVRQAVINH